MKDMRPNLKQGSEDQEMEDGDREAKAVIAGLACRFPKSRNVQEFWDNLIEGKDLIGLTRWPQGLYDLPPRIGAIHDLDKFDSVFFNISDEEANNLNPLLRHLLEVTYECVVDSALSLEELQHTKTGLYLAIFGSDTDFIESSVCPKTEHVSLSPYIAGELMSSLSLTGPCITMDTACSSSMAALHTAVKDLESGACKYAIVAGCNLVINPLFSQQMLVLNMISKEGQSRVFDQEANGYVRAEGCAALLIASSADICQRVYANIIDIGVNCDGYKESGITNPSSESQAKLMAELYARPGIDVNEVKYVEAHGTGTQVGDIAETAGLTEVFCKERSEPLLIGSVKSNMGHSEATAALASIIKCILAMHYKEIPGNLNYRTPNPEIQGITEGKLKVVDKTTPLQGKYVGVSSFGFGGVNGHVILEPYSHVNTEEFVQGNLIVPITGRNLSCVEKIRDFVSNNRYNIGLLGMLSESMLSCEQRQPIRAFIQLGPKEEDFTLHSIVVAEEKAHVCLCLEDFTGTTISASCDLLEIEDFRQTVKECSKIFKRLDPVIDVHKWLQEGRELAPDTKQGVLLAFTIIIALVQTLEEFNVIISDVLGCGLTEVIAAYIDGALNLDQCLCIADCLGGYIEKVAQEQSGRWKMYEVEISSDEAFYLSCWSQVLIIHDDEHVTMAIDSEHEEKVLKKLQDKGGDYRLLPSRVPVYSGCLRGLVTDIKKDLRDIIPSPRYRSSHMYSSCCGLNQRLRKHEEVLCNADYFSELICKPVNMFTAVGNVPENSLVLSVFPSTESMLHNDLQASGLAEQSAVNLDVSQSKECRMRSGIHKRLASASSLSYLDISLNDSVAMCDPATNLLCQSSARSFCCTLGELHNLGLQVSVQALYNQPESPLGIEAPFLSPLVEWDHSVSWNIPRWMEFSARVKDVVVPYTLKSEKLEGIHSPVSVILYHTWRAISNKVQEKQVGSCSDLLPVKLYDLDLPYEDDLTNEMLPDVTIQVLPGTKCFVASIEDIVVLKGRFDVSKSPHLPRIPGYDLDVNENIQMSPKESEEVCIKTEIQWEDDWLSFINDIYEFAIQMTETSLQDLTVDPVYHLREAKECPAFLMVFEKYTGLCRSGGCVMQFRRPVIQPDVDFNFKQLSLTKQDKTLVSKVMVYSLPGYHRTADKIIIYTAEKEMENNENKSVVGIICLTGGSKAKEIMVPAQWKTEEIEILVPYIIASHLLYDLARAKEEQTVLILPPIDTTGVYLLSLACQLGCSVFTSTSDQENLQCLENLFPHVRVLPGENLEENIMLLTQGQGVDVCIRLCSGDIDSAMQYVGQNGHLIQCMSPPEASQLNWGMFKKGTSLSIEKPFTAFTAFTEKSLEDIEVRLFDLQGEPITKLSMEGFPEHRGILYNQENCSGFIQPVSLDKLMTMMTEPSLGNLTANLMESDALMIENLHTVVASKPKDYSIADISSIRNPLQRFEDQTLNRGMIMTPPCTKIYSEEQFVLSPEINIVSFLIPPEKSVELKMSPVSHAKTFPPTSTPMTESVVASTDTVDGKGLEESYLEEGRELPEPVGSKVELTIEKKGVLDISEITKERKDSKDKKVTISENLPRISVSGDGDKDLCDGSHSTATPKGRLSRMKGMTPTIEITEEHDGGLYKPWSPGPDKIGTPAVRESSFMRLMSRKSKPIPAPFKLLKPKVDLLKVAPPMTPMTPALKEVLTPSKMEPNLVPLNPLTPAQGRPLFIVHPITGQTKLLEALGGELKIPCYGLQRTMITPSDSVHNVASYYKDAIEALQGTGPYWVAGYSFGSMIAFEIAIQLQSDGKKVDKLIMLDGSPLYIQAQISQAIQGMPTNATHEQIRDALEAGALVNWMTFYGPVKNKNLIYGVLRKLPNLEDRLDTAVDLTMGNTVVSESPKKTNWLTAKSKLFIGKTEKGDGVFKAAKELIRLKRKEKATDFITHVNMAKAYKPFKKFEGDIYLHRVKTPPVFEAVSLATDYGLQEHCTGMVHLKFYSGDHESFLVKDALYPLMSDIHSILGIRET